jgi:gamma-glutamyltranspeptidase
MMEANSNHSSSEGSASPSYQRDEPADSIRATVRSPSPARRSNAAWTVIRRALSVDFYTRASNNPLDDDDDYDDDGIFRANSSSGEDDVAIGAGSDPRRWFCIAFAALALLTTLGWTAKNNRKIITPEHDKKASQDKEKQDEDSICLNPKLAEKFLISNMQHGAVASDQEICSELGIRILLELNGNAIDAAVTTALCLGAVNPSSSGLGGGAFMLIHAQRNGNVDMPDFIDARSDPSNATKTTPTTKVTEVIDCREQAPGAASTHMYDDLPANASVYGGLAISVFGELKCLELAHARFGSLPWKTIVEPVVALTTEGVAVSAYLAQQIESKAKMHANLNEQQYESLRELLTKFNDWNHPLLEGELMKNRALSETLKRISEEGVGAVYGSKTAESLAQEIKDVGGIVTANDISQYRAVLRDPVVTKNVFGLSMVGIPPPSSGGAAVLGAVTFLSGFVEPLATFSETLSMHRIVEASKHVFAIRMSLSDPAYNTEVVQSAVQDMLDFAYMGSLRRDHYVDNITLPLSNYGGPKWAQLNDTDDSIANVTDAKEGDRRQLLRPFGYLEDHGTSHFSIVDKDGNTVAMTTSINTLFGSNIRSVSTGLLFSNTMDDFAKPETADYFGLKPADSNFIMPMKRPLSSMSPTLVFRQNVEDPNSLGELMLSVGASGGPKIISAVLQVLLNHLILGKPLLDSIVQARVHDQLIYHGAAITATEKGQIRNGPEVDVLQRTRDALDARGHRTVDIDFAGTVQAVSIDLDTCLLTAASDPRKGGSPAGF